MKKNTKLILIGVISIVGLVVMAGIIKMNHPGASSEVADPNTKTDPTDASIEEYGFNTLQDDTYMAVTRSKLNKGGSVVYSNQVSDDRILLVLSAPSVHDEYYKDAFQKIVDFQIEYANKILGNDNVVIVVDEDTKEFYENKVPSDVLLVDEIQDIWMRDFTSINPLSPIQFTYTWASMSKSESKDVQNSFNAFANALGIERQKSDLLIDGGNIVDNYKGKIITTTRFLEDNNLDMAEGKERLRELLHAKEVAILEPDEDTLAHADGMVAWIDDNTLLVNNYGEDKEYRDLVIDELKNSFSDTKIVEVPMIFQENKPGEWEGFNSACGVNLNAVLTKNNLYVPTFGIENDEKVLGIIKANTSKKVIPISAEKVCPMGGSVRCLTWQITGRNAESIILSAREK